MCSECIFALVLTELSLFSVFFQAGMGEVGGGGCSSFTEIGPECSAVSFDRFTH